LPFSDENGTLSFIYRDQKFRIRCDTAGKEVILCQSSL